MKKNIKSNKSGFTIVEMMIAITIFSVVLLLVSNGIIKIGRLYHKGITQIRTQETTRSIMETLSRTLQFSNDQPTPDVDTDSSDTIKIHCIGEYRYTLDFNQKVDESVGRNGIVEEKLQTGQPCFGGPIVPGSRKELLGKNMRLLVFEVAPVPDVDDLTSLRLKIAYGDDDLLTHYNDDGSPNGWSGNPRDVGDPAVTGAQCKSGNPGGSFCAVAELDTTIKRRLN